MSDVVERQPEKKAEYRKLAAEIMEPVLTVAARRLGQAIEEIHTSQIKPLRDEIERLRKMLRKAEDIARNGCLVPPDGGSPTPDEILMCEAIADRIRALWNAQ